MIKKNHAGPAMFVTWRYTHQCADGLNSNGSENSAMHAAIQQHHSRLARATGAGLLNIGLVWESLRDQQPDFHVRHSALTFAAISSIYSRVAGVAQW
ncbi:MAG: hypothetical protein MO846_11145 [Candidatus Devosia symbiotica]|nr:hypothetical protein [Candidatus Devosia symbiotica]